VDSELGPSRGGGKAGHLEDLQARRKGQSPLAHSGRNSPEVTTHRRGACDPWRQPCGPATWFKNDDFVFRVREVRRLPPRCTARPAMSSSLSGAPWDKSGSFQRTHVSTIHPVPVPDEDDLRPMGSGTFCLPTPAAVRYRLHRVQRHCRWRAAHQPGFLRFVPDPSSPRLMSCALQEGGGATRVPVCCSSPREPHPRHPPRRHPPQAHLGEIRVPRPKPPRGGRLMSITNAGVRGHVGPTRRSAS